ncbi:hypothetical protein [Ktedonobacter racemifer]|uniref:Uncharacterized protein n=1 Tax=Ktedonobacter racemifer DSM 44963 TaxID=485913 RepID=D6TKX9_KTERA|nr:hypothetical protein [Ktedonobacter racemifer]EFH86429.1 hypothetical protein Krac_7727 [Ktedonobacter racemifer DSM 44963]
MTPILILLALVLLLILLATRPRRARRRARQVQARIWQEAEARGEITILDDRGSDRPTIAIKRRRD